MTNRNVLLGRSKPSERLSREEITALDQATVPEPKPQPASKLEKPPGKKGGGQQRTVSRDLLKFRWSPTIPWFSSGSRWSEGWCGWRTGSGGGDTTAHQRGAGGGKTLGRRGFLTGDKIQPARRMNYGGACPAMDQEMNNRVRRAVSATGSMKPNGWCIILPALVVLVFIGMASLGCQPSAPTPMPTVCVTGENNEGTFQMCYTEPTPEPPLPEHYYKMLYGLRDKVRDAEATGQEAGGREEDPETVYVNIESAWEHDGLEIAKWLMDQDIDFALYHYEASECCNESQSINAAVPVLLISELAKLRSVGTIAEPLPDFFTRLPCLPARIYS